MSKASRRKERNLKKRRNNPGFQATMNHTPTSTKEKVCVFCGSREITRHHIIFQRFAPELRNDPNNIIPMCSNCQKVYHHYTDCLLSYLKVHGKIHHHEIREATPLVINETEETEKDPPEEKPTESTVTIHGGTVTINFN